MQKIVQAVNPAPPGHWVGNGFPVRTLFAYDPWGEALSPFLMLDYAAPTAFTPTSRPRGVGEHPHRGFETVTIVYSGEVAHRDSSGGGGIIGSGDVQWMTAAAGIVHDEFHSPEFTRRGGILEMAQLWVNLPAKHKMSAPRYQTLVEGSIPDLALPDDAGRVRVIAGVYPGAVAGAGKGASGPAATYTELNVWDVRMNPGKRVSLRIPAGHSTAIAVLKGRLSANGSGPAGPAQLIVFNREGDDVAVEVQGDSPAVFLLLSGVPLMEPIAGHGPFVMNSRQEIETAITDFQSGRFGTLAAVPQAARAEQVI